MFVSVKVAHSTMSMAFRQVGSHNKRVLCRQGKDDDHWKLAVIFITPPWWLSEGVKCPSLSWYHHCHSPDFVSLSSVDTQFLPPLPLPNLHTPSSQRWITAKPSEHYNPLSPPNTASPLPFPHDVRAARPSTDRSPHLYKNTYPPSPNFLLFSSSFSSSPQGKFFACMT